MAGPALSQQIRCPTPFGLFAGVAAASAGDRPTTRFGYGHRMTVRADARWLGGIIDGLEQHPDGALGGAARSTARTPPAFDEVLTDHLSLSVQEFSSFNSK